jgi:hypothetical protein
MGCVRFSHLRVVVICIVISFTGTVSITAAKCHEGKENHYELFHFLLVMFIPPGDSQAQDCPAEIQKKKLYACETTVSKRDRLKSIPERIRLVVSDFAADNWEFNYTVAVVDN